MSASEIINSGCTYSLTLTVTAAVSKDGSQNNGVRKRLRNSWNFSFYCEEEGTNGIFFFLLFTFGRFINSQCGRLVRFSFIKASSPYVLDFNRCLDAIVKALGFAVYFKFETFGFRPEFLFQHCFTCFWNDIKKAIVSPIVSLA